MISRTIKWLIGLIVPKSRSESYKLHAKPSPMHRNCRSGTIPVLKHESNLRDRNDKPHIWKENGNWKCKKWPGSPVPSASHWFDAEGTQHHYNNWVKAELQVMYLRHTGKLRRASDNRLSRL